MNCTVQVTDYLLGGKDPQRVALRGAHTAYTYGELDTASREFEAHILECGAVSGDRVLLLSANSFHWIAAYLGILRAQLVCVPLPPSIEAADLAYIVESTQARFAFIEDRLRARRTSGPLSHLASWSEAKGASTHWFEGPVQAGQTALSTLPPIPVPPNLAALMFTSGSTGKPRGVMVTHRNIVANANSIIASLDLLPDERMMAVLPFHYCFGTSLIHTFLRVGAELVIETAFTYPEVVLQRMESDECTSFAGVPSHYQILLRNSSLKRRALPRLRALLQAGGHLAPAFLEELQTALPHARIFVMYGQTEATARLSCLAPEMLAEKHGSIGMAIPGVTLRLLDSSGEEVGTGETGEIVAEGDNVTLGYWRAPEETSLSFRDGKLYTGDLATRDADGFLYVVDRAKEFVKCGGTRVSYHHLEDLLLACEELIEAAVVAVPDEVLGEAIRAFVVPRPKAAPGLETRLRTFCKTHLSRAMTPRDIIVLPSLPKNGSGKVARWQLKSLPVTLAEESVSSLAHS